MKRCRQIRTNFEIKHKMSKENETLDKAQNGNDFIADNSGSLPIGDVEILLIALEHIGKWGEEEEERWDDSGECAMDALTQYRYSMSKGN